MKSSFTTTSLGIFTLAVLALGAGSAAAGWRTAQDQPYRHALESRQDRQHQRIHAGRENGELTRGEFRRHTGAAGIRVLARHFAVSTVRSTARATTSAAHGTTTTASPAARPTVRTPWGR